MKNNLYTVFVKKTSDPARLDSCLIETTNREEFSKAIAYAKKQGLEITRVYKPDSVLDFPDFISAINI